MLPADRSNPSLTPEAAERPRRFAAAAIRAAFFLGVWLLISGGALADLPIGLAAAALATWTSLRLLPAGESQLRPIALLALAANFLRQSIVSGVRVARLAFDPSLPLHPGFVTYRLRLPEGGARCGFQALSSLLPGSLPTGTDTEGSLVVHCLDIREPVASSLAAEEALFMRATGHD
jgi:multicomponent Na+:H+ antiporter subunit E